MSEKQSEKKKKKSSGIPIILLCSKYESRCRNCGAKIKQGDAIFYFPTIKTEWGGKKVVCKYCFLEYIRELIGLMTL